MKTWELHCAVIVVNNDITKVLAGKRTTTRELYPDKWDFGCAKPNSVSTMVEDIEREYKEDFGIDINVLMNNNKPLMVDTYYIDGRDNAIGTILIAIANSEEVVFDTNKYSDARFLDILYATSLSNNHTVPGFERMIRTYIVPLADKQRMME